MRANLRVLLAATVACVVAGCLDPSGQRPGLRLTGEEVAEPPGDWSFTNAHKEIAIEVATPYGIPHSVTIWCASDGANLYLGARNPESKRWPAWADRDPNVRLGIADTVYPVRLEPIEEAARIAALQPLYGEKYDLPPRPPDGAPPIRYWRALPR